MHCSASSVLTDEEGTIWIHLIKRIHKAANSRHSCTCRMIQVFSSCACIQFQFSHIMFNSCSWNQPTNRIQRDFSLGPSYGWTESIRRSVRSCSQTIPEALAKFWRAAGSKVKAFAYMVRKLRSIAFQRCIWRGGLPLVEMAENKDFPKKKAWKTSF